MRDTSDPKVQYWSTMSGMLWWAAAALGAACMLDTLHQAFTLGLWRPYAPLYYLYYPTMTAYAGSREREKWVRGAKRYEEYTGEFFVYGWLAIALFIFAAESLNFSVQWPQTLTQTMAAVWGVYLGVKFIGGFRPGLDPDPAPTPSPNPLPGPMPDPDPSDHDTRAIFMAACRRLGTFSAEDLVQDQGCSIHQAGGWIGLFLREGLIRKGPDGRYQWVGN